MAVIVQFDLDKDHVKAVGVLSEAEETYHGVGRGTILVSTTAVRILHAEGIRFRVIGERAKEKEPQ